MLPSGRKNLSAAKSNSPSLRRTSMNLPTPLRVEVRSPGFSSRLSSLVRDQQQSSVSPGARGGAGGKRLQPPSGASAFNPKYQGFGSLPRVRLERRSLPRLSSRNSSMVVRSPGSANRSPIVTVKVAPAEPFSPFKTNESSSANSDSAPVDVADPRRVLAALQELSRSRKRGRHGRRTVSR